MLAPSGRIIVFQLFSSDSIVNSKHLESDKLLMLMRMVQAYAAQLYHVGLVGLTSGKFRSGANYNWPMAGLGNLFSTRAISENVMFMGGHTANKHGFIL